MIKVRIKERNIIELLEDAKKGDLIDLSEISAIDYELINNKIEDAFKERLEKEIVNTKNSTMLLVQEEISKYKQNIALLSKEKEDIKTITLKEEKSKFDIDKSNIENSYKLKEVELSNKIELLTNELTKIKQHTIDTLNNDFNAKINKLKEEHIISLKQLEDKNNKLNITEVELSNKINLLNQEKDKIQEINNINLVTEITKKEAELQIKFKEELALKEKEISNLINQRAIKNVKQTGEDLESWCDLEVKMYMQNGLTNCTWSKDNDVIKNDDDNKGSKADFIFNIYSNEEKEALLTNICLEMKDENPDSIKRKRNDEFFKQLDKNRIKKGCKYALLVSNLELDKPNDLPMYKVLEYPDMYVVRPGYLMTFLNMIVSLSVKFKDLILNIQREKIEFKSSTDLIEEFDAMKKTYLENPLNSMKKDVESIVSASNSIITSAEKINKYCDSIKIKYIEEIENKLNRFNLKKVIKKYEN